MKKNEVLTKLKNEFNENINSHVFLVETNDIDKSLNDLKEVLKEVIAPDDELIKNQIENETYLEMIMLRSDGKSIKTEAILDLQERIKTKPVLSKYMIYIIIPAEDLGENSSNKLLKTIEEPNPNVVGFLLTKNSDLLLPTIKSRCESVTLMYDHSPETEISNSEVRELAQKLVKAIEQKNHIEYYKIKSNDKLLKDNNQIIENLIKDYYNMACDLKTPQESDVQIVELIKSNNDFQTRVAKSKYLNSTLDKITMNMNADLLLEKIFFDLKEV